MDQRMNNFRDYASRIRTNAVAAASKLPTFDDMAAQDDYIHSEDFNVRGQQKKEEAPDQKPTQRQMEPDETSSTSSWSLLDRPSQLLRAAKGVPEASLPERKISPVSSDRSSVDVSAKEGNTSSTRQMLVTHSSGSLPLLAAVADALNETAAPPLDIDGASGTESDEVLDSEESSDDGSVDSLDDADDPIMSMIRNRKPPIQTKQKQPKPLAPQSAPATQEVGEAEKVKKKNRFMEDLDLRLATPEECLEMGESKPSNKPPADKPPPPTNPFGNWVNQVAKPHLNRFLKRPQHQSSNSTSNPAPLFRERPQNDKNDAKAPEEDYQVSTSSSVLADDELAQLAKLKNSSKKGYVSKTLDFFHENRHLGFIIFTLILAAFVYFFSHANDRVS